MTITQFDTLFYSKLTERYDFLAKKLPKHLNFYRNKIKGLQQATSYNVFWEAEVKVIENILNKYRDRRILEIGCGIGQLSIFLKLNGFNIEACEVDEKRIEDFKYFNNAFNTNVVLHEVPYQALALDNYDLLLAVGIGNSINSFEKDYNILNTFLSSENKFIYIEAHSYEDTVNQDYNSFCLEQNARFYNNNQK